MKKKYESELAPKDYEKLGRILEDVYVGGHKNIPRLLWFNFVKGLAYGLGLFLAGTVIVALMMWFLGLFDNVPVVGPFVDKIVDTVNK